MSVVTGALGSLAPKLLQLLHGEYKLQKGVRNQVEWLHSELETIRPFLNEVSDVPWNQLDEQVKVWAREVREASYDMEDILDTFLVGADSSKDADSSSLMDKVGNLFRKVKARRDMAGKIKDMTRHLEEVSQRRKRYKLDEIVCKQGTSMSSIDPRTKAMYKKVTELIGVDKSREELISKLNPSLPDDVVPDKKMTKKVSIVGVGGLGKTTLARVVYDNLKSQYDCAAFVSVGRDVGLVTVFKDILFGLNKNKYAAIHNDGRGLKLLIDEVREFLENKRYFIVIDDVWDVSTWEIIKQSLVDNNCGSKVITTTRKIDVAKAAGEIYELKPLSIDDCMELFYTRIFGADRKYLDNQPNDVSGKILKKCAGIPLAVIAMASLFAGKPECTWSEVYSSIGFDSKDNMEVEDTMKIISFSYYDLPPHLRTCLLYLSTYPEDYEIKKDSLIWKWIAEGFINGDQGERLFELGERYFSDLINRSLIQAVENQFDGSVSACHVHDIVLDLLRMFSFEEKFVAILDGNAEAISPPCNIHRVALHNRTTEHVSSEAKVVKMPKVRSYTAFCCHTNWVHIPSFRLLRVLDFRECSFKEGYRLHFEHLSDLLHLRYLWIKCQVIIPNLSNQITNLKLLQTLVLYCYKPVNIDPPTQLLCLLTNMSIPDGIGKLTSMEQLSLYCDPKMLVKELSNLRELRALDINFTSVMDKSMQRDFVVSLSNLQKIQKIDIHTVGSLNVDTAIWAGFVLPRSLCHLRMSYIYFPKMPSCINPSSLPNLSYLKLWVDTMDEKDMKHLARLPALSELHLTITSTVTASIINASSNGCFQKLRYFYINAIVHIQQHNKEDSCISLNICNREGALPFVSRKSNCSKNVPFAMMPNLEVLHFNVFLLALKDNNNYCGNIGIEYLPSIRELKVSIGCDGVSFEEVDIALVALRHACEVHPNHPTVDMYNANGDKVVFTQDEEDEEFSEEEVFTNVEFLEEVVSMEDGDEEDEKQQEEAEVASQMSDTGLDKQIANSMLLK